MLVDPLELMLEQSLALNLELLRVCWKVATLELQWVDSLVPMLARLLEVMMELQWVDSLVPM